MAELAGSPAMAGDALLRLSKYFHRGEISGESAHDSQGRRAIGGRLLSRPLGTRQGGALHARRELHRLVLVEDLRQGRRDHRESQQTDYPSIGADKPEYEPRGCPRGASFSWYTYSPARVRYPYVRGLLLDYYREAKERLNDPVLAWADVVEDLVKAKAYKSARGRGGFVRAEWWEAAEIAAPPMSTPSRPTDPTRVAGSRRSRPCRW